MIQLFVTPVRYLTDMIGSIWDSRQFSFGVVASGLMAVMSPVPGDAQQVKVILDDAKCDECQIVADSVTVLDGRRNKNIAEPVVFARMSDGRILLTPSFDLSILAVFDESGRFMQIVGRKGEGPGEFKGIGQIKVGKGDTVRVYDHWNPRVSTLSPRLEYLGSRSLAVPVGVGMNGLHELPDGRLLTQRSVPTDAHAGYPVHLLSRDGVIVRSFGAKNPAYRRGQERLMWRSIAPESEGRFWIAPPTEYSIELWDLRGAKLVELRRNAPWFEPHPNSGVGIDYNRPNEQPNPGIVGLRTDNDGLLWALIWVPDTDWRSGLGSVDDIYGRTITGISEPHRYMDSIVEVIEPESGRLVVSKRFDQKISMLSPDGVAVVYEENQAGFPFVHVWQLRIVDSTKE